MPQRPESDPWISFNKPRPNARLRLLCFPYAGGGAGIYRNWVTEMPEEIEVLPIQLPGRERRLREQGFTRMEPLIDVMAQALLPYLEEPFAFFGHSMGAIIGYELAQRIRTDHQLAPVRLCVSARRAPQCPPERDADYLLPDDELCDRLREMNGTPVEVLDHPELMQLMLPVIRTDFELNDTYEASDNPPLDCAVSAFGGLRDADVERKHLEAWQEISRGSFKLRMFPGDHFFLNEDRRQLINAVAEDLL